MNREMITRKNLSDLIAEKIKDDIIRGKYSQGDRLPTHDELCKKWGVSRVTLREALKKLSFLGLIDIHQGRGTFVNIVNSKNQYITFHFHPLHQQEYFFELLEARKVIETELARFAAKRRSEEGICKLEELVSLMELSVQKDDSLEYAVADFQFHKQIGLLSNNSVLISMLENIQTLIQNQQREMFQFGTVTSISLVNSLKDHKEIFHMLQIRNSNGAALKMKQHLTHMERRIAQYTKCKEMKETIK